MSGSWLEVPSELMEEARNLDITLTLKHHELSAAIATMKFFLAGVGGGDLAEAGKMMAVVKEITRGPRELNDICNKLAQRGQDGMGELVAWMVQKHATLPEGDLKRDLARCIDKGQIEMALIEATENANGFGRAH